MSANLAEPENLQAERASRIADKLRRELGAEICRLLDDPTVIEIVLNPDGVLWVDRLGEHREPFGRMAPAQAESLMTTLASTAKTQITRESPRLSCELPLDGSRFQGSIPPIVSPGPAFAIRKRAGRVFTFDDYEGEGILLPSQRRVIEAAVDAKENILVVGGTKSGKTTFLNAIVEYMSRAHAEDRLAILEDTVEIQCSSRNRIQMRTCDDVDMETLLVDVLRYSPDRILVGEVRRGAPAMTLIDAWNTGHGGGLSTTHANDAVQGLTRIEALIRRVVTGHVPVKEIAAAINIVVWIAMTREGRRVKEVVRVLDHDGKNYVTQLENGNA